MDLTGPGGMAKGLPSEAQSGGSGPGGDGANSGLGILPICSIIYSSNMWSPDSQALCPRSCVGATMASAFVLFLVSRREMVNRPLEHSVY